MHKTLPLICLLALLLPVSCIPGSPSELTRSLNIALKEKKISAQKMESILEEYQQLKKRDKDIAREYVLKIVSAIEMGADSTHIDVLRRRMVRPPVKVEV